MNLKSKKSKKSKQPKKSPKTKQPRPSNASGKTKQQIIAEYARKHRVMVRIDVPTLLPVSGVFYTRFYLRYTEHQFFGMSHWVFFFICFSFILSNFIFSFFYWRCPSCDKFLGRVWGHNYCKKCGVQLLPTEKIRQRIWERKKWNTPNYAWYFNPHKVSSCQHSRVDGIFFLSFD